MSYAIAGALQAAIFDALIQDSALGTLIGSNIYDAVPTGNLPEAYVSLGSEQVRDASDQTGDGAVHTVDISIITSQPGYAGAKAIAAAVSDALQDADLSLARGRLVSLRFQRAQARRIDKAAGREIRMRFRARVEDQ
ncbi:hypothetical protein ROLI_028640 [Roseobacter fucihabitans]|uniref:Gene transfer agent protein n=1 Tax=Roseobacter fucihabitans TaxID=1537242 RepID=A0ABZ2BUP0_9RHOB|nr:DUF3168 domain-containing protein [Roseobacter litoralis]MBC6964782.1 hypothetical protein [Roseobacter litoralis]